MSVETFDIHQDAVPEISATAAAVAHFKRFLETKGLSFIRIHLEKSGCTGYKYVVTEVENPEEGDVSLDIGDDVKLCLPATDLPKLNHIEFDCVQQGANFSLIINNPNARDECGCGESFSF
jgi:iron-sulfur cluster assembly accessory protein